MSDHDGFFDEGPERAELVAGRYRLPHPETGVPQSWTRATTHAELPEDSYALTRHQLRELLIGLHRRPDLIRMVEAWAGEPGRDELDGVIASAHEAAGSDVKANRGTAIHGVLQQVDRAWDHEARTPDPAVVARLPEWATPYVAGYLAELQRQGLTPLRTMTERRVINLALGCAGTLDNLYEEADGSIVLGDKKTGRLDYTERKFAVQLAVYAGADYMLDPDGSPPIDLKSIGLRSDYAVLIHIDPDTGACTTYRVDIRRGQYGANLASDVRAWRNTKGLLLPYVPPGVPAQAWQPAEGRHLKAVPSGPMVSETRVIGEEAQQWDGSNWIYVGRAAAPVTSNASAGDVRTGPIDQPTDPGTFAESGGLAGEGPHGNATTVSLGEALTMTESLDDLMKLDKAALQGMLRELDPGATVNHQRKILAQKILTLRSGGTIASSTPTASKPAGRATPTASKPAGRATPDPAELPAGPATNGAEDPTNPRSQAFHRARLAEIARADSAGVLGRIHSFVLRVGGEQAWTDELTEAARARLAVLDAGPPASGDDFLSPEAMLRVATSSEEIASVWERTTVGGSAPDRWTPELIELANDRLREVTLPAPTANPYAPQQ